MDRRNALSTLTITGLGLALGAPKLKGHTMRKLLKGRIKQSVCRWTYGHLSVQQLCDIAKEIGFSAIDLIGPDDWPTLQKNGIGSSMCNGAELNLIDGWNHPEFHPQLIKNYTEFIPKVSNNGYTNLICFSGNRRGMNDLVGLENCVRGLEKILPLAEKHNVVVQMELLNSKIDHPDYMADSSLWGVELCRRLESPSFKLLYDIYHMQINEGDVIRTIRDYHPYFGHYHTAGVPGRHEIDHTQELNYPAIMNAIYETGFKGYVAQEFIPTAKDKINALKEAVYACDI